MRQKTKLSLLAGAVALGLVATACAPPANQAGGEETPSSDSTAVGEVPERPSSPVTLNILDNGGKVGVEPMIERFMEEHPDVISGVTWESASEADTVTLLKPQVDSGNLQIDLVIAGTPGLAAGLEHNLWEEFTETYADRLPNLDNYIEPAQKLQELGEGHAANLLYCYCGPILTYNPDEVENPPANLDELLEWAETNPGKFGYARPANSGIGRTFLLALPYMLGDEDPNDPENGWDKTWAYLEELGEYIDNYPTSTSQQVTNFSDGTWTAMPSSAGWDVGPRSRGQIPPKMEALMLEDTTWVMDPQYAVIPRGVDEEKLSAILLLIDYMLTPEVNAMAPASGQYVPGSVVEGVTDEMIPEETRELLAEFNRDWYAEATAESTLIPPPTQEIVLKALDTWDREIGAKK